ncbi:transcriptional regulator TACO1-like protein [Kalaharituber pfeilii]|nr:transcriptional regulator TACO1-like protein [Kalaharituber pfeilii]
MASNAAHFLRSCSLSVLGKSITPSTSISHTFLRPTLRSHFSTTTTILSGHSRWSKIKHDKGKNDKRKSAEYSKISREIITAAKVEGVDSLRLKAALELGKKAGMTKATMENAVRKGLGITAEGVEYQLITIECIGPGSVALIIDCLTDNKLRTMQEVKYLLKENGATVTPTSYLFSRRGRILLTLNPNLPEPQPTLMDVFEEVFEKAMETAGVEDVEAMESEANGESELGGIIVTTHPLLVGAVMKDLMAAFSSKLKVEKMGMEWVPNEDTMVEPGNGPDWCKLDEILDKLEEHDDIHGVYTNVRPKKAS